MELSKFIESKEFLNTSLRITVDYNSKEDAVTEVLSVVALRQDLRYHMDLTDIFIKYFDRDLDKAIMETNWKELYKLAV